jgi:hypothetical protein
MKFTLLVLFSIFVSIGLRAQDENYYDLIAQADALYATKDFKGSANKYSEAFKSFGWKGALNHRYDAACSWALANVPDSAIFQLDLVVKKGNYADYGHIINDPDLNSLHTDKRWQTLINIVKQNKEKADTSLNKPLASMLDSIYEEDQKYRMQLDGIGTKYGWKSKEINDLWKIIGVKDSINLIKVMAVLDKYGWLGPEVIGGTGNQTLFLVIQHSDQLTQEKYLPMMRDAVKNGKARGSSLALLEDRVALGQGKKQTYGSQIGQDNETQSYFVLPLDDPDNVDKRRKAVGLGPLSEYVAGWKIKWDAEQYKKDLPEIEKKSKGK